MAMVVKNNLSAVRTLNILNSNSSALQKGMARVSSGMKITGAQDDAAGFAISERMRVRIRALDQANQNTQNDSSLMKTAEGAVGNTIDILKALKEKCINAANDSNTDEDRQTIQKEINQYIDQIDDNALVTFNGKTLIDGTKNNAAVATKTILLNQSLKEGTLAADKLTSLSNRAGDSLGIQSTDYFQVSWVENGKIHTTSGRVEDNSIKSILSKAEVDATVAATDKNGLIGTTEEVRAFESTNMTKVYNATGLTKDQLTEMFGGLGSDLEAALTESATTNTSATNTTITIGGYYMGTADEDGYAVGTPTKSDITITIHPNTDATKVTYDVSGVTVDGNPANSAASAATLFTKPLQSVTCVDSDGQPTSVDGYIDAPVQCGGEGATGTATYISSTSVNNTNAIPTEINADLGTSNGDVLDLAKAGYYYKTKDADGNDVYQLAKGTITRGASTALIAVSPDATTGVALYRLDPNQTAVPVSDSKTTITYTDSTASQQHVRTNLHSPDPITVYNPNNKVSDKYDKDVYTPDKTYGVAVVAKKEGVDRQISGLTINILDQDHNVKKAANAALDQFKQYQRAENVTGDKSLNFHIGSEANQAIKVGLTDMRAQALGLKGADGTRINVFTKENANASINVIENALTKALDQQTTIGAVESRLEYTSTNLTTASENVQASESTIRDADMAKEMTNYTKANVLLQAAQAMLAQANQSSSSVLSLLQ